MHLSVASLVLVFSLALSVVAEGFFVKHDVDGTNNHGHGHGHKHHKHHQHHKPHHANDTGDVHDKLRSLNKRPSDLGHLGLDGVYRIFDVNGTVVDYLILSKNQTMDLVNRSSRKEKDKERMREALKGADPPTVTLDQVLHPPRNLLPPKLKDPKPSGRRGQRPPTRRSTSPVPGGLKDPPYDCELIECDGPEICWEEKCMLCSFWGELPLGNCV
ncbi:hypothetical protein ACJ73_04791 [Blastomyces percursus]|uniref:Uncharacterized protein n=1 Tax=Blastomyces percursus TaxID=1658174 RepID=A0A1J9QUD8_9EURO|nr:hypothetical protein ACJ73_04791 [Blastomyces percursus]